MSSKNRYLVLVAVTTTHALVFSVLLGTSAAVRLSSPGGHPFLAYILTRAARRRVPLVPPPLNGSPAIAPIVEPITLAPPRPLLASPRGRDIDWSAAARRAAAAAAAHEPGKRITFGFPPGGQSAITLGVYSPHTPAHYAGESDRTMAGEDTEWTSDRCYVTSDPPVPGEPDFLKNARVTRAGCLPPDGWEPGELFKGLPAYRNYPPP